MDNQQLSNATFEEIVFENRNKSYGAFVLRKLYTKNVFTALGVSTIVFSLLLFAPLIKQLLSKENKVIELPKKKDEVTIVDVPLDPRTPPPPPLPEIEVPKIKTVKFVPLEVAKEDKEVREPDPKSQEDLNKTTVSTKDQEGKEDTTGTTITGQTNGVLGGTGDSDEGDDMLWVGPVDIEPQLAGGHVQYIVNRISEKLKNYIRDREIHGVLVVVAEVGRDGKIGNVRIPKGKDIPNCKMCSDEVVEIVNAMPNWKPATSNGRGVRRIVQIGIRF